MKHADLRFYGDLRCFLATDRRSGTVTRSFDVPGSVKDAIEACGVPHTEVEVIVANRWAVDFSYRVQDGDRIAIYPPFHQLEVEPAQRLSPSPLDEARFVVDGHLGKLARYLRLLGFDSVYNVDWVDSHLVEISTQQDRILLTRDVELLMHGALTRGYFVRAIDPMAQVIEVGHRYGLASSINPFTRCMACNGELCSVEKRDVIDRLQPETRRHYDEFFQCADCARVYWRGSHYRRLMQIVDGVRDQ